MSEDKSWAKANATATTSHEPLDQEQIQSSHPSQGKDANITLAQRGEQIEYDGEEETTDAALIRDRTLLSAQEEKALLRRIDWRIMTICSLLFLMKNIDADNISNARIMNKGTHRNIMTELGMTSDQYNLLNVLYYVYHLLDTRNNESTDKLSGSIHCL